MMEFPQSTLCQKCVELSLGVPVPTIGCRHPDAATGTSAHLEDRVVQVPRAGKSILIG